MRNVLLFAVLGLVSVSIAACGDADSSSTLSKRGGRGGGFEDPVLNDDPGPGEDNPADPNATSRPNAPATPGTTTGAFTIAVDNNVAQVDLASKTELTVTVTPSGGFTGDVNLAATGLPADVIATFTPATVNITGGPVTAKVAFTSTVDSKPTPAGTAVAVNGVATAAADKKATANVTFKVNNAYTMIVPVNAAAMNAAGVNTSLSAQFQGKTFTRGLALKVRNLDSAPMTVHGGNQAGMIHGTVPIAPGQLETNQAGDVYVRTLNGDTGGGNYRHGDANGTNSSFRIMATL